MTDIYVALVIAKRRTCDPTKATRKIKLVPALWRDEVIEDLAAMGYDPNGDKLSDVQGE